MFSSKEITGFITRIEEGCAYAKTDFGDVFIPYAAAIGSRDTCNSLKEKFEYQEEVKISVIEQAKRNNCELRATNVTKVRRDPIGDVSSALAELSTEIHGPLVVHVTKTEESFAFAQHESFGSIFIPGDAFDGVFTKSVCTHVAAGDLLLVKFKAQREVNNCRWVAVEALKHFELDAEEKKDNVSRSWGVVFEANPTYLEVWDDYHKVLVKCHMMTYVGGVPRGERFEDLTKLFKKDDHVIYKAQMQLKSHYWAHEWSGISDADAPTLKNRRGKVFTADSYTQSGPCMMSTVLKSIFVMHPEIMAENEFFLKKLPDFVIPQ